MRQRTSNRWSAVRPKCLAVAGDAADSIKRRCFRRTHRKFPPTAAPDLPSTRVPVPNHQASAPFDTWPVQVTRLPPQLK